jgi:hypothetical protein
MNEKSTHIKTKFNPLIQLNKNKKYEMALVNLDTYYSFPNIDATNNNFKYSPDNGVTWLNIDISEGSYELVDIAEVIETNLRAKGHAKDITITPNNNTLRTELKIAENYKVDFTTPNSIRTVLGFNAKVYTHGINDSEDIVNILNVTSLKVTSDIIGASYSNGATDNVLYSFFPNAGPGYKIVERPVNLIYLPVLPNTISSMETKLVDQNGKLINLRGEEVSVRFVLREA